MPAGFTDKTGPIELILKETQEGTIINTENNSDETITNTNNVNANNRINSHNNNNMEMDLVENDDNNTTKEDNIYSIEEIANVPILLYKTCDPLDKCETDRVIVWETKRPFLQTTLLENPHDNEVSRDDIIKYLQQILQDFPTYKESFWRTIKNLNHDELSQLYGDLIKQVKKANGNISIHNVLISYCTGSHNNCQVLGSQEQAKGAVFYICPYMGKRKYPLQHSLTLLKEAMDHTKKYPSQADDSGTKERTIKHILQRVLNKINLKMELSDYQVAADLLGMPSIICSEKFTYGNPSADLAYQTHIQMKDDAEQVLDTTINIINQQQDNNENQNTIQTSSELSDFIVSDHKDSDKDEIDEENEDIRVNENNNNNDNLLHNNNTNTDHSNNEKAYNMDDVLEKEIGSLRLFTITEESTSEGDSREIKMLIPKSSLYPNRGEALQNLNRHEYHSFVSIRKKQGDGGQDRMHEFPFGEGYLIYISSIYASFKCKTTNSYSDKKSTTTSWY